MAEKIVKKVKIEVNDDGSLKRTSKDAQTLNRNMKGLSKQSSNASKNFSKTAQGMQGVLVPAYAEVAARVFALTALYQGLSKASDFRILMQGQAEYAKRTGKNMADISKQVQKAAKGMLDFQAASSAVALATTSGISSGQIVKMTKAAVDSSTALGRSVTDTMDRLTRGIVKAEPEILDEIGVIIRLDKVYKDYAQSVSKSTAELSEGEKATARYNAIMGQLESKFGGIGDAVDPNYIRASAAATMDILAQAGAKLIGVINPFFKFLAESKAAIIVILLVVLKTLAGKVFPAFAKMGMTIANIPAKMDKNITKMTSKIKVMNAEIIKSRNIASTAGVSLDQSNKAAWRGKAYTSGASAQTKLKSMRATNVRMGHALGTGDKVATGKYAGLTRKVYQKRIEDEMRLRKEIGKTHKTSEIFWKRATINVTRFNKILHQTGNLFVSAAKSATQYFTITKNLIADQGVIRGTIAGLKLLAVHWKAAGAAAGFYQKAIKGVTAGLAFMGVIAAGAAAAINALFGIIMWMTLIISLGKMLLNLFVDFDTPFKRAADAAKTLNDELKEQETLFSQKDKTINFEGAAASFDEAMANATFADNFASSLYESTSTAMKALSADMGEMGFWEGAFDWMKSLFGMGSMQYQLKALNRTIDMTRSGPGGEEIMASLRKKHKVSGDVLGSGKDYLKALNTYKLGAMPDEVRDAESFAKTEAGKLFIQKMTLNTLINSKEFQDSEDAQERMLMIYTDLAKAQKDTAESARKLRQNLTEMTTGFEALSKAEKKFTDTLLTKTVVHDMAIQQKKLQALFKDEKTLPETKALALVKAGVVPNYQMASPKGLALTEAMKSGDQDATQLAAIAFFKQIEPEVKIYLGGISDMIAKDKEFTMAISERLIMEQELLKLKTFAPKSSITAQMELELQIAQKTLVVQAFSLEMMKKRNKLAKLLPGYKEGETTLPYSAAQIQQAETQYQNNLLKANLKYKEHEMGYIQSTKAAGGLQTIKGLYQAKREDLAAQKGSGYEGIGMYSTAAGFLDMEEAAAHTEYANEITDSIQKSAAQVSHKIMAMRDSLKAAGKEQAFINRLMEAGWGKYLDAGILDPKNITQLLEYTTGEGKSLMGKVKSTKLALTNLEIERDNIGEHKILIGLRKKMAAIDMNVQDKGFALDEQRLETAKAIATLQLEVNKLQLEQDLKLIKDTMKAIADGFGKAIGDAFKDIVSGVAEGKWDKFRNTMSSSLMNQAASSVGGMAQNAVFGNKGLVASGARSLLKGTKYAGIIDDIFPKTQLEVAQDSLAVLKEIRDQNGMSTLLAGKGSNTIANTGSMGDPAIDGIIWFAKLLWGNPHSAANGGIFPGGFRAFANGGIANKSTLGLIGEGKYNEAVVPLPDGKSIPVKGVGSNNVTVNVAIDSNGQAKATESTGGGAKELGYQISQAIQQELVTQQRPGGLLSSY